MSDSLPTGKDRRWIEWILGVAIVCGTFLWFARPVYHRPERVDNNQLSARQTFIAVKAFAEAHGGQYPRVLPELSPVYLAARAGYWNNSIGRRFDWLYVPGLRLTSPADWIVFASPTDQMSENHEEHARFVVTNVGDIAILPEEDFERKLAEQVKAMLAPAPEKP